MMKPSFASSSILAAALVASCEAVPYEPQAELWPSATAVGPSGSGGLGGRATGSGGGSGGHDNGGNVGSGGDQGSGGDVGSGGDTGLGGSSAGGSAGTAGSQDTGGQGGSMGGQLSHPCTLAVTMTTVTDNGRYSPRNVGAIWIDDASGKFLKTLEKWGNRRDGNLSWYDATYSAGLERNTVDAITGATLSSHKTHNATWNCTDTDGNLVDYGPYSLHFEMTDANHSGPTASFDFSVSTMPFTLTPPDEPNFKGIKVVFTP
jgi:hypothetical protein